MPDLPSKCTPGTFEYIEQKIRLDAVGTEFGSDFEWLCRFFLLTAPKYKGVFKAVWLWNDWPKRWGADKGIDLVAQTVEGKLWAIQAKAVRADRAIPKSELDSFLSESNRLQFDYRLIIATTDDIGRNAQETLAGQEKPVGQSPARGELLTALFSLRLRGLDGLAKFLKRGSLVIAQGCEVLVDGLWFSCHGLCS